MGFIFYGGAEDACPYKGKKFCRVRSILCRAVACCRRLALGGRLFTRVVEAPTPTEVRKEPKGFDLIFTKMKPVGGAAAVRRVSSLEKNSHSFAKGRANKDKK